jgi:hypothetical protein
MLFLFPSRMSRAHSAHWSAAWAVFSRYLSEIERDGTARGGFAGSRDVAHDVHVYGKVLMKSRTGGDIDFECWAREVEQDGNKSVLRRYVFKGTSV